MTDQKKPWQHDYGVCGDCCVDGHCKECGWAPEEVCACHCPDRWKEELDAAKLRIAELEKLTAITIPVYPKDVIREPLNARHIVKRAYELLLKTPYSRQLNSGESCSFCRAQGHGGPELHRHDCVAVALFLDLKKLVEGI